MKPGKEAFWRRNFPCVCFLALLILYPLRHVSVGVDLWDEGYSYANFKYAGAEYMGSMWYFATWLANGVGSLLMKLPFADTMLGMKIYTGFIVSLLASAGFLFCVKVMKLPCWLAFSGELAACSLCWLPTAALYTYLTYTTLTAASICLYIGLKEEKGGLLAAAGVVLGIGVGVRFSNLAHVGMILAVWLYALVSKKTWKQTLRETGLCALGYAAALGGFLAFMGVRYGFAEYVGGISRLFQMTEAAEDYSSRYMVSNIFREYYENTYWLKRAALVLALEMGVCLAAPGRWEKAKKAVCLLLTGGLVYWLSQNHYYGRNYAVYDAVYQPGVTVLALTLCLSAFFLAKRNIDREDKLPAAFAIPTVLLTALGGNNALYSSINDMFLILPFLLYMVWKLCRGQVLNTASRWKMLLFPAETVLVAFTLIFAVQAFAFGGTFVYEEATGGVDMTREVTEIPVLRGIRTGSEKAEKLTGLYRYLEEGGLRDRKVILYGEIPGVAYYMELVPAMNVWGDMRSYSYTAMQEDLEKIAAEADGGGRLPIVILEEKWAGYLERPETAADYWDRTAVEKLGAIGVFMNAHGYEKTYDNGKFAVYLTCGTGDT